MNDANELVIGPAAAIAELTELLQGEIAVIEAREFDRVSEFLPRKTALLAVLEGAREALEADSESLNVSRQDLDNLQQMIRRNAALLARMSQASQEVIREITRIRDRHQTAGLYGRKGQKRQKTVAGQPQLDQSY